MGPVFYVKVLGRGSHTKGPRSRVPGKGLGSLVLSMGPDSRVLLFRYAPATLLKKTLAQVFSCEFCEISKNTFFTEHFRTTASVLYGV